MAKQDTAAKIEAARPPKAMRVGQLPTFDTLIVDADSMVYQIAWTTTSAGYAQRAFDNTIQELMSRTNCDDCHVLVKGEYNFRYAIDPFYKFKRREHDYSTDEVRERTAKLLTYVQSNYGMCEDGAEADDWCRVLMKQYQLEGKNPVVAHIDKDLNMIPGWHYHIKLKDFYYQTPEQAHYFFMKQVLIGDMASDSIPGLNKIGEVKASEKYRGARLSEMKKRAIHLWQTNAHGIQQNNPEESYDTYKERIARMFKSVNLLLLRDDPEQFRELTRQEILDWMTWGGKIDPKIDAELEAIRMGVYSLHPAAYTADETAGVRKNEPRESQQDIEAEREAGLRERYRDPDYYDRKVRYKTSTAKSRIKAATARYGQKDLLQKKRRASR